MVALAIVKMSWDDIGDLPLYTLHRRPWGQGLPLSNVEKNAMAARKSKLAMMLSRLGCIEPAFVSEASITWEFGHRRVLAEGGWGILRPENLFWTPRSPAQST